MNKWIMMGRLTREPEIRHSGETMVARFSIAVDRRKEHDGQSADFFNLTAFGKRAEFVERWLHKGTKILASGRVENNNYTNQQGQKVYGFAFLVDDLEFAESKRAAQESQDSGFVPVPDDVDDGELPFN